MLDAASPRPFTLSRRGAGLLLLAILGAGAALRLHGIGEQSLWLDELFATSVADLSPAGAVEKLSRDCHPPLYFLLLKGWRLLGDSDGFSRALSALFGVGTIPVFYALARTLFGRGSGLVAAALLAISPFHVHYSQEARQYTLTLLLAVASLYLFLAARGRPSTRGFLALVLLDAAGLYTHVFYAFHLCVRPLLVPLVAEAGARRSSGIRTVAGIAIAGLVYAPWWSVALSLATKDVLYSMPDRLANAGYTVFAWSAGFGWGPSQAELREGLPLGEALQTYAVPILSAAILFDGLVAFGTFRGLRRDGTRRLTLLLLLQAGIPLAAGWAAAEFTTIALYPRYVIVGFPAYLLLLGEGLRALPRWSRAVAGSIVLAICSISIWADRTDPRYRKEDYRSVATLLGDRVREGDRVLLPPQAIPALQYYLDRTLAPGTRLPLEPLTTSSLDTSTTARRLWIVENRPWDVDPSGELRRTIEARTDVIERWTPTGFRVHLAGSTTTRPRSP